MRYLRMLSNSLAAAVLGTAYMVLLVLLLNPALPLNPAGLAPIVSAIAPYYLAHLMVIFYTLLVLRQLLASEVFSPAWASVGVLVWLTALTAAAGAVVMWRNLATFSLVLAAPTAQALHQSAIALTVAAVLALVIALARRRAPEARAVWGTLFLAVAVGSVAVPIALRGPGRSPVLEARPIDAPPGEPEPARSARVTVIAVDAASLDYISSATAEGRLPNFGRILDAGAVRHLATVHPTSAETVWAAAATGKLPQKNGVRSAGEYRVAGGASIQLLPEYCFASGLIRFGFLVPEAHSSATFRTRTLWSILSSRGVPVGVVDWPLTQPAPVVRGFLVTDAYLALAETPSALADVSTLYPPELQADAAAAMERASDSASGVRVAALGLDARHESAARADRAYGRIAQALADATPVGVMLMRYQTLDPIGHYYLRYAMPSEFGDVSEEERRQYGSVLDRHYAMVDEAIGRAMAALGPDDLLLVVSGYGMEPLGFVRRQIERVLGDPELSGTHEDAPDGFLMAYGGPVARGRLQARASIVDVVPTILYFLGLPVGRDMDGYVRTDLFQPAFTEERPITYIPTYDR